MKKLYKVTLPNFIVRAHTKEEAKKVAQENLEHEALASGHDLLVSEVTGFDDVPSHWSLDEVHAGYEAEPLEENPLSIRAYILSLPREEPEEET